MNKTLKLLTLLGFFLVIAPQALASLVASGDFANECSLSGWDQIGVVSITGTAGSCAATLSVNDDPDFEAEISQSLALGSSSDYNLFINLSVDTTLTDPTLDDLFSISLLNQDFDFIELYSVDILGAQNIAESLSILQSDLSSFANQNWSLSFFLMDGPDFDSNSSTVSINQVFLEEVTAQVPEPSSLALFILGFAGLMIRKKNH